MNEINHIGQLKPDARNPRKHNPRNIGMVVDSLHEVGAARSIVIDEDGNILAGNGTIEAAAEAGIERVQVVDADGETIIAVRRTGLTPEQKARLAILDNRTAETAEWDTTVLQELAEAGLPLDDLWNENEFARLTGHFDIPDNPNEHWGDMQPLEASPMAHRVLKVYFKRAEDVELFAALLEQTITDNTKSLWYPAKDDN